jgi:SPP1 gp7 family putative phage head morphogenesis protein
MTHDSFDDKLYEDMIESVANAENDLIRVYEEAFQSLRDKLLARIKSAELTGEDLRIEGLLIEIDQEITRLYDELGRNIQSSFYQNYTEAYYRTSYGIELGLNASGTVAKIPFPVLPTESIRAAFSEVIAGHTFFERLDHQAMTARWKIREAVSSTLIQGQTPAQLAKQIQGIYDTFENARGNAQAAARTELLRAYSYGQQESMDRAEDAGVKFKYRWDATLDGRTRDSHQAMDGQIAKLNEDDGKYYFKLPSERLIEGPRMTGPGGASLPAAEVVNCRCRKMALPYGIAPTARAALTPSGDWVMVAGDVKYEDWVNQYKE